MEMLRLWRQIRRDRSPEGDGNASWKKEANVCTNLEEIDPLKGTETPSSIPMRVKSTLEEIDPLKGTETLQACSVWVAGCG